MAFNPSPDFEPVVLILDQLRETGTLYSQGTKVCLERKQQGIKGRETNRSDGVK